VILLCFKSLVNAASQLCFVVPRLVEDVSGVDTASPQLSNYVIFSNYWRVRVVYVYVFVFVHYSKYAIYLYVDVLLTWFSREPWNWHGEDYGLQKTSNFGKPFA